MTKKQNRIPTTESRLTFDIALMNKSLPLIQYEVGWEDCDPPVDDTRAVPARVAVGRVLTGPI